MAATRVGAPAGAEVGIVGGPLGVIIGGVGGCIGGALEAFIANNTAASAEAAGVALVEAVRKQGPVDQAQQEVQQKCN